MTVKEAIRPLTRRKLLQSASALGMASILSGAAAVPELQAESRKGDTVQDRFWLWSHAGGAYNGEYGLKVASRITPVEAAHYLGTPNVFMVQMNGIPTVESLNRYVLPFMSLREVAWSIVDPGFTPPSDERPAVIDLAFKTPVITGVVMDDFFVHRPGWTEGQVADVSLEELKNIKKKLKRGTKRLDLWAVLYTWQVSSDRFPLMVPYLEECDVIQIWPWRYGDEVAKMPETFAKVDKMVPGKRKALGTFMWNFGRHEPLPISVMEQQCELGLKWLRSGKIEGMVFGTSEICDRGLETVDWTRQWIRRVGTEKL